MPILKSLRICEREIGDEGIRTIHQFIIETNNSLLNLIELLNDNIDLLGCEFISRIYEPSFPCNFKILTLDYNRFGNEGLNNLMNYLPTNTTFTYLSLNYCDINEREFHFLKNILNILKLQKQKINLGNPIKEENNKCMYQFIQYNSIEELNIKNANFSVDEEIIVN